MISMGHIIWVPSTTSPVKTTQDTTKMKAMQKLLLPTKMYIMKGAGSFEAPSQTRVKVLNK